MSYQRVLPRDFFNEAKLLKCLGALVIEGALIGVDPPDNTDPFTIDLTECGELFCGSHTFTVNDKPLFLFNPYNSKEAYPLYCRTATEDISVFDGNGKITDEFNSYVQVEKDGDK